MPKQIIIAEQHHIAAVFFEEQIQELVVSTGTQQVSDIYLGLVENVIPGIDAAFVNIGDSERNGFIHVTDLGPLRLKKSAASITELLAPQQKALVQVMKEPTGNKGPRLTGNITLPGRYLVLMPYGKGVKLSRRIREDHERSRLRALAVLIKPAGMGLLVRTEADNQPVEAIMEDLEMLQRQWESIQEQAGFAKPPTLLNRDDDFIQRVLRDMYSSEVNTIMVDSQSAMKRVKQHLSNWSGGRSPQGVFVDYHREQQSVLEYYRVNAAIREALKPRVELPSGGYIIMEPTEALTVIDVNSGSFTRSATARETVLWTNREAATEIARQLRLRNIGGVIVVDFIDMDTNTDRLKLLEHFNNALRGDKSRPQIAQLSELGLVELTRKRQGQNLYELFGQTCPSCGGLGHLASLSGRTQCESLEGSPITPLVVPNELVAARERRSLDSVRGLDAKNDENLVNHPNYQEQSSNNGSRRRRRRNEIALRDENNESEVAAPTTQKREEVRLEPEETTSKPSISSSSNTGEREISLRDRKSRSRNVRKEEPIETVAVEMSALEQEIYALMGISPLIYVDHDLQNSRSVLVQVRQPGESAEEVATSVAVAENPDLLASDLGGDADEMASDKELDSASTEKTVKKIIKKISAPIIANADDSDVSEDPEIVEPEVTSEIPEIEPEIEPEPETVAVKEEEQKEEVVEVRRRRRRRSSTKKEEATV